MLKPWEPEARPPTHELNVEEVRRLVDLLMPVTKLSYSVIRKQNKKGVFKMKPHPKEDQLQTVASGVPAEQ